MASVSSPRRRKMSVSVRTAVVFPVPPFCERTAIVAAIVGRLARVGGRRSGRQLAPAARRGSGGLALRGDLDEAQAVAAHEHLVTVLERAPLHPLAVDEHAVEAAVVEHANAVGAADDQRMAT